jgi:hypothetical protein
MGNWATVAKEVRSRRELGLGVVATRDDVVVVVYVQTVNNHRLTGGFGRRGVRPWKAAVVGGWKLVQTCCALRAVQGNLQSLPHCHFEPTLCLDHLLDIDMEMVERETQVLPLTEGSLAPLAVGLSRVVVLEAVVCVAQATDLATRQGSGLVGQELNAHVLLLCFTIELLLLRLSRLQLG